MARKKSVNKRFKEFIKIFVEMDRLLRNDAIIEDDTSNDSLEQHQSSKSLVQYTFQEDVEYLNKQIREGNIKISPLANAMINKPS